MKTNPFHNLSKVIFELYSPINLVWQILAILLTALLVLSGLDWFAFQYFRNGFLFHLFFLGAGILGFVVPLFLPLTLLILGKTRKDTQLLHTAWTIGQAAILGLVLSSFYKIFTGRPGPVLSSLLTLEDTSKIFRFGIWRGGIFWGWPSSHTTTAVAIATCIVLIAPKHKLFQVLTVMFAAYVSIGAGISFHWFSDMVAGIIFGIIVGKSVAKYA